jgi:protein-tyrosine phosphatase
VGLQELEAVLKAKVAHAMKTVLFLCTGNYFRSRFAEQLFNHVAAERKLEWVAESRALAPNSPTRNPGPISVHTLRTLKSLGVPASAERSPMDVTEADFLKAARIIAAKEAEHRPLARERFPSWEEKIEYWHCHDLDCAAADEALRAVEERVRRLLLELEQE